MPYEVVDPTDREQEGEIYPTLTAAMVKASPTLEVWEVADDHDLTRMTKCWPDPEFEPRDDLEHARRRRTVAEHTARANREATALLTEYPATSGADLHGLISFTWAKGYLAGFGECARTVDEAFKRVGGGE